MKGLKFLALISLFGFLFSCGNKLDDPSSDPCNSTFDQLVMFENLADNLIVPQYQLMLQASTQLNADIAQFTSEPNSGNLATVRTTFLQTWEQWQRVAQYSFGPAEDNFLRNQVNNFPLNMEEMIAKIESGSTDFISPDDFDKGYPALDYLLFGTGESVSEIIGFYNNPENVQYKSYLEAIGVHQFEKINEVVTQWESGFAGDFKNNTGTAAGTSLSQIINGLNQNYELIKREKIGVPSGVLTLGFSNPDRVEALHSGASLRLAKVALESSFNFYQGKSSNGDFNGLGLDDFLEEVGQQDLNESIKNQFEKAFEAFDYLEKDLAIEVVENQSQVEMFYNEIAKNVVMMKTDLPSILCVAITYIDNPSDSD